MGLPSNQGNLFYWARPLITMEREGERETDCMWESEKMGWVSWWWWWMRGGVQKERRLGVGWCLRCYVWLIWAHLFFPFSLTPLLFFPFPPPPLSVHCSQFSSFLLTHTSFLPLFLSFPYFWDSSINSVLHSFPLSKSVRVFVQVCASVFVPVYIYIGDVMCCKVRMYLKESTVATLYVLLFPQTNTHKHAIQVREDLCGHITPTKVKVIN